MQKFHLTIGLSLLLLLLSACGLEEVAQESVEFDAEGATIVAIGDSIFDTHGDGEDIPDFAGAALGLEVTNLAVGGAVMTNDEFPEESILSQYVDGDWDWLLMLGGGNDLNDECGCGACAAVADDMITADASQGALPDFVADRTAEGIKVVYVGYYEVPDTAAFGFDRCEAVITDYLERVQQLAADNELMWYVDAREVIDPNNLEWYIDDHVHPSVAGAERIGTYVADQMQLLDAE